MAKTKTEDKGIPVDEQFLKDFADKGGKIEDKASGSEVSDVDKLLEEVADKSPSEVTPNQVQLHKRAVKKNAADTTREDEAKAQKEAARIERLREQERKQRLGKAERIYSTVSKEVQGNVTDPMISRAGAFVDRVSALETIGGIGLLLAILIFLLFVVVRVNQQGDTRIKQLWYMLNGRASLAGSQLGGAASADFGPGGTSGVTNVSSGPGTSSSSSPQPIVNLPIIGGVYSAPDIIQTPFGPISLPDISVGGPPTHTGGG